MALSTTNITTTIVGNEIGYNEHNIGYICSLAKFGGINSRAFKIYENGYSIDNGELIDDAIPLFNFWSDDSPSEFVFKTPLVVCQLKRGNIGTNRYGFGLHHFANYNHTAIKPELTGDTSFTSYNVNNLPEFRNIEFSMNFGSYDFSKIIGLFNFRVTVKRDVDDVIIATRLFNFTDNIINDSINVPLSAMTSDFNSFKVEINFQNAVNGEWFTLNNYPFTTCSLSFDFGISVYQNTDSMTVVLPVDSNNYSAVYNTFEFDRFTTTIRALNQLPLTMTLYSVYIKIIDENGNYVTSMTYGPNGIDSPLVVNGMSQNQEILFTVNCGPSSGRIYATGTQKTLITSTYVNIV